MAVNKVVFSGKTIIDLTSLTITPEVLAEGVVAINAKGEIIVGAKKPIRTWDDLAAGGYVWNDLQGGN